MRRKRTGPNQLLLPFLARRLRREAWFRRLILGLTAAAIASVFAFWPGARDLPARAVANGRRLIGSAVGVPRARRVIESEVAVQRREAVSGTRALYRGIYDETKPAMRRLLEYAGLTPDEAVIRWGNYDKLLLLPSTVFAEDEARSYRLRPNVRSVWLRNVALPHDLNGFFLVPDRPELQTILPGTGAAVIPGTEQTTNSWGLRGPEPDPSAPIRGIVLGDSNMQGLLVADDQTPPERLARDLEARLNKRVSILNTGHLGYSPEQYARTLDEYADRFRPDFVLITFCVNDFGDVAEAQRGGGHWDETRHWIEHMTSLCRKHGYLYVMAPIPYDHQVTAMRRAGGYPGRLNDEASPSSLRYVFPIEDLVDEFVRIRLEASRTGRSISENPLYNVHLGDHHFSPRGCEVWARAVGRRLAPLLEMRADEARRKP